MSAHFSWPSDIRSIIDFTALLKIDGICEHVHQKKQFPRSMCRSVCIRYLLRMVSVILVHQKGLINIVAMKAIVKEGTLSKLTQRNRRLYQYMTDWKRFEISKENIYVLLFLLKKYITAKYISAGHLTSFNRSWLKGKPGIHNINRDWRFGIYAFPEKTYIYCHFLRPIVSFPRILEKKKTWTF